MRQFYVYGFKVRGDFTEKSARTYDNERRRIESWLSGCISSDYTAKGKQISISADSRSISSNPLYSAWKSKSFTDNDLLLHFFILHYLLSRRENGKELENGQTEIPVSGSSSCPGMTAGELADRISEDFGCLFDGQTVRLKLKEYEGLGLLSSEKYQKSVYYQLSLPASFEMPPSWSGSTHTTPASALSTISWFTPWKTAFYIPFSRPSARASAWSWKITAREAEILPSSRAFRCRFSPVPKQGAGTPVSMQ